MIKTVSVISEELTSEKGHLTIKANVRNGAVLDIMVEGVAHYPHLLLSLEDFRQIVMSGESMMDAIGRATVRTLPKE